MGKISAADKMRMQTLREQGLGAKAIVKAYPEKQWKLDTVERICRRIDVTGSAVEPPTNRHQQTGSFQSHPHTSGEDNIAFNV